MNSYRIRYGVGGGYNDINEEIVQAVNEDQAGRIAYECAVEVFESYGIFDKVSERYSYADAGDDISEEDENEIQSRYEEEVDRWCRYEVVGQV